jgi:hypothetical protein
MTLQAVKPPHKGVKESPVTDVPVSLSDPPSLAPPPAVPVPDAPVSVDPVLVKILSWKRGHGSKSEGEFLAWLHTEIKARGYKATVKAEGCIVVTVPLPDNKASTTLFSCHVDTVDSSNDPRPQGVVYDPSFGHIFLDKDNANGGTCLGADDGAGVWLLLEMIKANVPGTYVFHRGEERGGIGSRALLTSSRPWLEEHETAIAFDRADDYEVVTHQGGQKCASDKFGTALCTALNLLQDGFKYKLSQGGTFTDTKVYRGVIAECVNVGVGYHSQHGTQETLDWGHLLKLRDACLKLKWDALPVDRDPTAVEYPVYPGWKQSGFGDFGSGGKYEKYQDQWDKKLANKKKSKAKADPVDLPPEQEIEGMPFGDVLAFVEDNPDAAAALLIDMGAEVAGLKARITYLKGALQ